MTCRATSRALAQHMAVSDAHSHNPYRAQVLSWYRKCLRAAFDVAWDSDDDALYVLAETRRLFQLNATLRDVDAIARKVREVEMRYELALHYRTPYPRPMHKTHGSLPQSTAAYAAYLDSSYDHPVNYNVGQIVEGSGNYVQGGLGTTTASSLTYNDDVTTDAALLDGFEHELDTAVQPVSTRKPL